MLACSVTEPHFDSFHAILGPLLGLLLVTQALGGLIISRLQTGDHRPCLAKLHKFLGLLLYLGGLVNGALGVHTYSMTLTCPHAVYLLAMLLGSGSDSALLVAGADCTRVVCPLV